MKKIYLVFKDETHVITHWADMVNAYDPWDEEYNNDVFISAHCSKQDAEKTIEYLGDNHFLMETLLQ